MEYDRESTRNIIGQTHAALKIAFPCSTSLFKWHSTWAHTSYTLQTQLQLRKSICHPAQRCIAINPPPPPSIEGQSYVSRVIPNSIYIVISALWARAGQELSANQILRRKGRWSGHSPGKLANSIIRQARTWNPQGKRNVNKSITKTQCISL